MPAGRPVVHQRIPPRSAGQQAAAEEAGVLDRDADGPVGGDSACSPPRAGQSRPPAESGRRGGAGRSQRERPGRGVGLARAGCPGRAHWKGPAVRTEVKPAGTVRGAVVTPPELRPREVFGERRAERRRSGAPAQRLPRRANQEAALPGSGPVSALRTPWPIRGLPGYPSGGPRRPTGHAGGVVSASCEASSRPSRRRAASRC
jgi:hypothetical protein